MAGTLHLGETQGNQWFRGIFALGLAALLASPALADQRVTFPSFDEDLTKAAPTILDARLYRPEGTGPFPAVVGMHGCGGRDFRTRDAPLNIVRTWAERLMALGYVVLLPDSFRPRGVMEICTQEKPAVSPLRHRPRDAYGALAWLRAQPYVRRDATFLIGWSNGGMTTLAALRADNFQDLRQRAGGDFNAAVALYPGCASQVKSKWTTRTPLLILSGAEDDWTPAEPCRELAARSRGNGEPVEFHAYPGAYHGFDGGADKPVLRADVPRARINGKGAVTIAADPAARADAFVRAPRHFARHGGIAPPE
ncbi:MAG: dienelactone hydrolase family protein [Rhodospirillales bacterium]